MQPKQNDSPEQTAELTPAPKPIMTAEEKLKAIKAPMFEATTTQIAQWKQEYGAENIQMMVVIPVSDKSKFEPKAAYFRKPNIDEIIVASTQSNGVIQEGEFLFDSCWLAGDEIIKYQIEYKYRACVLAHELIEAMTGFMVKI